MEKEQIEQAISAAFDSLILINKLQSGEDKLNKILSQEKVDKMISDNIEHLKVMMEFEWFNGALSSAQAKQIQKIIK